MAQVQLGQTTWSTRRGSGNSGSLHALVVAMVRGKGSNNLEYEKRLRNSGSLHALVLAMIRGNGVKQPGVREEAQETGVVYTPSV